MWQHNRHTCTGRDYPIYFKTDRCKYTVHIQCVHIIRPILWPAELANGLLHIRRIYTKPFLSNSPHTAGVTDADWTPWLNKQLCYLEKYTLFASKMFGVIPRERKKKKKSDQQREGNTLKCVFTLVINHYPLWHWLIGLPQIPSNSYENPGWRVTAILATDRKGYVSEMLSGDNRA